jgi:hypothetical protein
MRQIVARQNDTRQNVARQYASFLNYQNNRRL